MTEDKNKDLFLSRGADGKINPEKLATIFVSSPSQGSGANSIDQLILARKILSINSNFEDVAEFTLTLISMTSEFVASTLASTNAGKRLGIRTERDAQEYTERILSNYRRAWQGPGILYAVNKEIIFSTVSWLEVRQVSTSNDTDGRLQIHVGGFQVQVLSCDMYASEKCPIRTLLPSEEMLNACQKCAAKQKLTWMIRPSTKAGLFAEIHDKLRLFARRDLEKMGHEWVNLTQHCLKVAGRKDSGLDKQLLGGEI